MNNERNIRLLALYLPQYYPFAENDRWWGKGFTEWTNVGKARPLFRGHYQPKVPADLGYYDLRLPEVRQEQADMACEYGIEAFCYWHYWFGNGRVLLDRVFSEVVDSGKPDFPFCLAWANHSWEKKLFDKSGDNTLLMKQEYPGMDDHTAHFYHLLKAFKDERYVRVNNKPFFMIFNPDEIPHVEQFIALWNRLARLNGLEGIHFVAQLRECTIQKPEAYLKKGFNAVNMDRKKDFYNQYISFQYKVYLKLFRMFYQMPNVIDYAFASRYFTTEEDRDIHIYPTLIPNWDHSPRSKNSGFILKNSTPELFARHIEEVCEKVKDKPLEERIVIVKSWNEWGEGNYLEPDLKFGRQYLEALQATIHNFFNRRPHE